MTGFSDWFGKPIVKFNKTQQTIMDIMKESGDWMSIKEVSLLSGFSYQRTANNLNKLSFNDYLWYSFPDDKQYYRIRLKDEKASDVEHPARNA